MNEDIAQFVEQLQDISAELKQRVIESETIILSKYEVDEFSKLLVSSATVLSAAEKAFVLQERISYVCVGLATIGFAVLVPFAYIGVSLLVPSKQSTVLPLPEHQISAKQAHKISTVKMRGGRPLQSPSDGYKRDAEGQ